MIFSFCFKRCISFWTRSDQRTQCFLPKILKYVLLKIVKTPDKIICENVSGLFSNRGRLFSIFSLLLFLLLMLFFPLFFWCILTQALHLKPMNISESWKHAGPAEAQHSAQPCDFSLLYSPTVQHRLMALFWKVLSPCQIQPGRWVCLVPLNTN